MESYANASVNASANASPYEAQQYFHAEGLWPPIDQSFTASGSSSKVATTAWTAAATLRQTRAPQGVTEDSVQLSQPLRHAASHTFVRLRSETGVRGRAFVIQH